jgi:hypothetical protein
MHARPASGAIGSAPAITLVCHTYSRSPSVPVFPILVLMIRSDRPLMHVNKKGRPVSQCHHCRGLRKSRAQHVKCDCAENGHSKEDCPLLSTDHKGTSASDRLLKQND